MLIAFTILLVVHGLIHLLGPAKAFHWAELPELTQPISPLFGALWLVAAVLFLVAAVSVFAWPRWWWAMGACAVAVSMFAIVPAWTDAKVGALANAVVLAGALFGFLSEGPFSLRSEYDNDTRSRVTAAAADSTIEWQPVDAHTVRARFTNAGHTISADLLFDDAGMLTNLVSPDRYQSMGGGGMRKLRWSTPMWAHRQYGLVRLPGVGEARWHEPEGEYAYIQLTIDDVQYNVGPR